MSTSSGDGNAASGHHPTQMPETINELAAKNTIFWTEGLEDGICLICDERYVSGPHPEFALKLPACGHVFGLSCITTWLEEAKNTCPMCRHKILNIPDEDDEDDNVGDFQLTPRIGMGLTTTTWRLEQVHRDIREAASAIFQYTDPFIHLELKLLSLATGIHFDFGDNDRIMMACLHKVTIAATPPTQVALGPYIVPTFNNPGGRLTEQLILVDSSRLRDEEDESIEVPPTFDMAMTALHAMVEYFFQTRETLIHAFEGLPDPDQAITGIHDFILTFRGMGYQLQDAVATLHQLREPLGYRPEETIENFYQQVCAHINAPGVRLGIFRDHPFRDQQAEVALFRVD